MSYPDREMAQYMNDKFGPFILESKQTLASNIRDYRFKEGKKVEVEPMPCDLCGERVTVFLSCRPSMKSESVNGARLKICLDSECTELILPDYTWIDAHGGNKGQQPMIGLNKAAELLGKSEKLKKRSELPPATIPQNELVYIATTFQKAGMGNSWKIIPDILKQAKDRKLSPKQLAVLQMYNQSCRSK